MSSRTTEIISQPLLAERDREPALWLRLLVFAAWLVVIATLQAHHVPWRDEVRALSNAQAGANWLEMLRGLHSEGHPALWYIILRAAHDLFGVREVLPAVSMVIAVAAGALVAFKSPFRIGVIAILLFSLHLGYEYSVVARNYGISALILFVIAAWYRPIVDRPWFGLLLLLLCNTNVPSVFLGGALYLYRLVEIWLERPPLRSQTMAMFALNGLLALAGVILCFVTVYPPIDDAAAATNRVPVTASYLVPALFDVIRSFGALGFEPRSGALQLFLFLSLFVFARSRPAMIAAVTTFLIMKLFFYFIYPAAYRHSILYILLLVTLLWIEADKRPFSADRKGQGPLVLAARWSLLLLLAAQTYSFVRIPLVNTLNGRPNSNAANLASILSRPEYAGATLMVDPDARGESVVYYTGEPYWLLRAGRMGKVTPFSMKGNKRLTLDDLLATADRLHRANGKPVVIALGIPLDSTPPGSYDVMYEDYTVLTAENVARFRASTRRIAALRGARSDESYDVYIYPR